MASTKPGEQREEKPPLEEPNYVENGRQFHGWRKGVYMFPCDEPEQERYDIYHNLFLEARDQKLHDTPIPGPDTGEEVRILDLGAGTGIWAIDIADKYPHAEVIALDLVNIQPRSIPANLRFRIPKDFEGIWLLGEDSFDLIHLRMSTGAVSSWPELYGKIFQHLKPGTGWLEQVEIDMTPRSEDGEIPEKVAEWSHWILDSTDRGGKPIAFSPHTQHYLRSQGFVDVSETVIRLPFNTWPKSRREKDLGRWYNLGLCEGLEALCLGPLTRVYRWSGDDVRRIVEELKPVICDKRYRLFHNMHIITARKPGRKG